MSTADKAARLADLTAELDTPDVVDDRPIGAARLDAARAAVNELHAPDATEETSAAPVAVAGEWMHGLTEEGITIMRSISIFGTASVTLYRGDEIVIDTEMLAADRDRDGRPGWAALLHDENEQVARWGEPRIRAGRAPRDLQPWIYGSPLWVEQREQARRAAWAETDPQRRAEALRRVKEIYGDPPVTSTILNTARSVSERAAEAQDERIRDAVARGTINVGPSRGGE